MMTGLMFHHQQQQQQQQPQTVVAENRSNLTVSASGETTVSIHNHQQYLAPPSSTTTSSQSQPVRKKRNLPGNPDPDAEVIALSPKTLLATNRFICEICNKGFQRDQNLQLHRRGHNLPWKLKQRGTSKEATRKKVYVCPEPACVHHAPARALGDLTGIKKHYSRKHGEKKWKCDKCSKKYAVQSDWKAHSKTCGTREYRCDCGTLFSRRDSFITHRAFCDALAEESARAANPLMLPPSQLQPPQPHLLNNNLNNLQTQTLNHHLHTSLKKEHHILPPWLEPPTTTTTVDHHRRGGDGHVTMSLPLHENPNPNPTYHLPPPSPHMSATALLQRAAQMGATISKTGSVLLRTHPHQQQHQSHVTASPAFNLSPRADHVTMSMTTTSTFPHAHGGFFPPDDDGRFEGGHYSFDGAFIDGNIFNSKKDGNLHGGGASKNGGSGGGSGGGGGGSEGLTRDFLGLRPLSHSDILGIAGIGSCLSSSHDQQNYQSQKPWQG